MEMPLKATVAREIDRRAVTEGVNLAMHDREGSFVGSRESGGMVAGDYWFHTDVFTRYVRASWLRRTFLRQRDKAVTERMTTVLISFPFCGLPMTTPAGNKFLSRSPLTLENSVRCPYVDHQFSITEGKITTA